MQAFPLDFVRNHGDKFGNQAELCRPLSSQLVDLNRYTHSRTGNTEIYLGQGWLQFVQDNNLVEGDTLVFHLMVVGEKPTFNVYIFKS